MTWVRKVRINHKIRIDSGLNNYEVLSRKVWRLSGVVLKILDIVEWPTT